MRPPFLALLPGVLTVYFGFNAGGYFPPAIGVACVVLAIALVLRLTLAERPLEGLGLPAAVAGGALALFAAWSLTSTLWSDSPGRAVLEFDRVLLYVLAFMLVASLPRSAQAARILLLGLAGGALVICLAGLLTRLLPDVFSVDLPVLPQRLSYPVTYWNGLGLLAALAIVAATHLTCAEREHPAIRVGAAAALPLLAATLLFTFSRASIALAICAVLAYALVARPRGLLPGFAAGLPPTVVGIKLAYDADLLAARNPTTDAAAAQGHDLALALLACGLVAAGLRLALIRFGVDRRMTDLPVSRSARRGAAIALVAIAAAGALVAVTAFDVVDRIDRQYERFKEGDTLARTDDARDRLTDTANNGRLEHWDEAIDAWHADELKGTGAGTYELTWIKERPVEFTVRDGHSLYLETLSEGGLVGCILLGLALGAMGIASLTRVRGPDRALWAVLLVLIGMWALHAAQDWMWELPVVTLWVICAGAVACARPTSRPGPGLPRLGRVVAALVVMVLAVTPVLSAVSHGKLKDAVAAFQDGDCDAAIDAALAATSALSTRAEPYAILSFCDARLGELPLARRMMQDAIDRDPDHWEYHYGMALIRGAAGQDPRADMRRAREANPLSGLLIRVERGFATNDPQKWKRRALKARLPID